MPSVGQQLLLRADVARSATPWAVQLANRCVFGKVGPDFSAGQRL